MSGDDDEDEALTWAGGRDPSHYESPEPKPASVARASKRARSVNLPDNTDNRAETDDPNETDNRDETDDADSPATSSVVLVCLGILGGIYALYTVGWFISWQREVYTDPNELELAAFHIQQVLAILAPPLWFAATLYFTRTRRPPVRLLWLVIGALLLVPWSFTFGR